MEQVSKKLVTIITELSLENTLTRELEQCGASGYTITKASGKGSKGTRDANWDPNSNIRVEVICDSAIATRINDVLVKKYYDNFAMVAFTQDIYVMRADKF